MLRVKDLMTTEVRKCRPSDDLSHAAQLMWDHCCGTVVVEDDDGRVVGIITDRDICMGAYTQSLPLARIQVELSMAREPATCRADEPIVKAEAIMKEKRLRRLPVLDGGDQLVGLISISDIAREVDREVRVNMARPEVDPSVLGLTLAAISAAAPEPPRVFHA